MKSGSRWLTLLAVLGMVCLWSGCAERLLTCPRVAKVPVPPPPQLHPETVFFATDRVQELSQPLNFSGEMNLSENRVTYGAECEDPENGAVVICDRPPWFTKE